MDANKTMMISAAGLRAQGRRMRVIAENLANANSLPQRPEDDPYRRKLVTFSNELDRQSNVRLVKVGGVELDRSEFQKRYDPGHPGSDVDGYVRVPNVNGLIEMMDMREAQRSFEANLNVIDTVRRMLRNTVDLLKQ